MAGLDPARQTLPLASNTIQIKPPSEPEAALTVEVSDLGQRARAGASRLSA